MNLSDVVNKSYRSRWLKNHVMNFVLGLATLAALIPLFSVFAYVVSRGWPAMNWAFFRELPKPVGEVGGGMANAVTGTTLLIGLACLFGLPWGLAIGIYLSEYSRGLLPKVARFCVEMLASVPSIIIGLFVYTLIVSRSHHFSAYSGGIALGILAIPLVARTTEELLKLVPVHVREAGLALGLPRWKVILWIVFRGSLGPISTGVVLTIARIAGETAPLLFTAFGNQFGFRGLNQPVASLPVQIYNYAISPFDEWHAQAWAGALVLVLFVVIINIGTRLLLSRQSVDVRGR